MSLAPGATIGIIGGGQLGRMSAMAAARLCYRVCVFSPEGDVPGSHVAAQTIVAPYTDHGALADFAASVDVVTFEFENVPADGVDLLAAVRPVHPSPAILRISQDRLLEKQFLNNAGIATAPWAAVTSEAELAEAVQKLGLPAVLKTTRLGYDGKGQAMLRAPEEAGPAFAALMPKPLVLEGFVDFGVGISVMGACGAARAARRPLLVAGAGRDRRTVAERLELIGLLGVEMFVTAAGRLLVNEIAPRPHNSGHWTIDACPVSQLALH